MDLEGFLAKLLRTAIAGAMLVNGVAWAADDCAGTTPCFSKVNDYLNGKRFLLPNQDLGYLTAREPDHGFPYSLFNLELSKDLKFTSSEQKLEPAAKCALLRGPYGARLFNTVNDWVVGMKGQPAADDLCSLDGLNSGLLTVQDPLNPQTMQTQPIVAASGGAAQFEITIGDVNQDGYDDIVVSKGDGIDIFTAVDVNNPSKGLRKAASFGIEDLPKYESITDYPHGSVAIGDFNHDGATDLITSYISETATEHAAFVPFYAMYAYSICPAVGFVLYSGSTDPAFQPYTCKAAFEIFKRGSGKIDPVAFGQVGDIHKNDTDPPRLVSGDFVGRNDGTVGLFADIPQCDVVPQYGAPARCLNSQDDRYSRLEQTWAFDPELRPRKLDEFRLKSNEVPPFPPVYKKRTDFLRAARLHWSGVGSDRDQVVLFAAQPPNNSTIRILNVDDNGKISVGPSLGVAVVGEHFVGMDAGRFDPPKVGNSNNFNRQISVLLTNNPKGTELFTYSVDDSWNLKLESLQNLGTNHYFGYGSFDDLDGMLHAIDAQSRSLKLGSPIKISVEDHLQPDVVLAIPPMHIDYIRDATGNGPKPLNLTVFPSTPSKNQPAFNTQFSFNSEGSSESKSKEATDSTWGFGGSVSGKVVIGDEKLANVTVESKLAAEGAWGKSNETKNSNYQTTEKSLNATTGFADHIYFTSSRQNTWAYPILGLRCPVDGQACPQKDKKTQFVLMSAPDMVEKADLDATTQEWYQPVQEPGNLFSYPWNQDQLKLVNPRLNRLTEPNWKLTDTAITSGKTVWKQGGSAGTTTGSVAKNKESLNISVSGQYVTPFYSAKGKVEVDISHSGSLETENTSTTTLDASTGIQTNTPGFTDSVATRYFYYYSSYVFGENPLGDSLITPKLKQADGQPVGQQVFGPLTVAYAADPFHGAASANWWRQAYIKPDIGLNHPSRWTWDRVNKIASFNYHEPITDPPNPRTILNDVFYKMKGLFISEASDDPANRIQRSVVTAGDVIQIQARVYNFSVADMPPGSSAHARFYGQEYDQSKASLAGDAFPIGEDNNGAIPGFNSLSNLGTLPNWKMASTTFDTKNYSGKFFVFWVVVWAEDADGKLLQEVEAHGLKQDPSTLTFKQITDVPVEDYSNNVGIYGTYTPFFVAPKISSSSTDALAAPIGDTRQLQTNDVLVEATPACAFERSWVRVTLHNTTGGDLRSEPVFFYDGDPASGGKAFDMQRIPFVAAGDTYALRTFLLPETSGPHNIFVRVGHQDINSSNPAITTLNVP